jgi:hypothetical protein
MKTREIIIRTKWEGHCLKAYFEDVDTRSGDMAEQFVVVVKVSPKHLSRLINRMLNFDRHTTTRLRFLDNLINGMIILEEFRSRVRRTCIVSLMIDFQR